MIEVMVGYGEWPHVWWMHLIAAAVLFVTVKWALGGFVWPRR